MAVPRFYKFVQRFDQDVQRCRGGLSTPAHTHTRLGTVVVRPAKTVHVYKTILSRLGTFVLRLETVVYVFLYMLPISMFSKQKYNILIQ